MADPVATVSEAVGKTSETAGYTVEKAGEAVLGQTTETAGYTQAVAEGGKGALEGAKEGIGKAGGAVSEAASKAWGKLPSVEKYGNGTKVAGYTALALGTVAAGVAVKNHLDKKADAQAMADTPAPSTRWQETVASQGAGQSAGMGGRG